MCRRLLPFAQPQARTESLPANFIPVQLSQDDGIRSFNTVREIILSHVRNDMASNANTAALLFVYALVFALVYFASELLAPSTDLVGKEIGNATAASGTTTAFRVTQTAVLGFNSVFLFLCALFNALPVLLYGLKCNDYL